MTATLPPKQSDALARFGNDWRPCPYNIHIKTLVALINKGAIEWRDKLPFIGPELFQWKINCEFRRSAKAGGESP